MKAAIYWVTNDWSLIRRIREKYRLPQQMNINYTTYAEVDEETLAQLKKGEPKFLIIRKMKQEQIENAAVAIKESQNYHMSFEDAQDYISKCGFDIPWNDGDVFVDDREITRTIGNVLKWRINSVWHNRAEKADTSKELILMYSNGSTRVTLLNPNLTFDGFLSVDMFIKWAYIDDLLPERKEERS